MTIEQEFFEAFNVPTKFYTTVNLGDLDNNYQEVSANTLQELFEQNNFWFDEYIEDIKDFHDWEEKYPPITPEIVLKLEEIILNKVYKIQYGICGKTKKTRHYTIELTQGWVNCDKSFWVSEMGKSRQEALLSLCIQLKDEIQDQVKELFR